MRGALPFLVAGAVAAAATPLYATLDGSGNNVLDAAKGAVGTSFARRLGLAFYADGVASIDESLPPPRVVSNALFSQPPFRYNTHEVSFLAAFIGQFVAHDMSMTMGNDRPGEALNITVPRGDKDMDPQSTGTQRIGFRRLQYDPASGTSPANPRAPINGQTHFLDASIVYGTSADRLGKLRTFSGGLLRSDPVNGLPRNTATDVPMGGPMRNSADQRIAGDPRANQNPGLLCMHALFVLEHNFQARKLSKANAEWDDEMLFQEARKRVMALLQNVVYNEYVPLLLGEALPGYSGYNPSVDASVDIAFAVAAYRYGHSGINSLYVCAEEDGGACNTGPLLLRDVYFRPHYLEYTTIAHYLRGAILQPESAIDTAMVDDVRNHLEGIRNDLAAVDVLRGRDAGLPSYSRAREVFGLSPPTKFTDITSNTQLAGILSKLYDGDVRKVDLWVGGLAERATSGAFVGSTFKAIIRDQFIRTRDGDRFWFENDQLGHIESGKHVPYLTEDERTEIKATTMADIIRRNTDAQSIPNSVMRVPKEWVTVDSATDSNDGGTSSGSIGPATSKRSQQLSPAVSLEWEAPAPGSTEIEITAILQGIGWFAIGLGQGMRGADIIMMRVQGGTPEVIDAKGIGYMLPVPDSSQDVVLVSGSEVGGISKVTFRRKLDTGDAVGDTAITPGANSIVTAWDPAFDEYAIHGANRAAGLAVDFLSGATGDTPSNGTTAFPAVDFDEQIRRAKLSAYGFHGLSLFFTWGCLVPAGVFTVRFEKHLRNWQSFHRWSMMLAATVTIPAAGAALAASTGSSTAAHQYVGVSVAVTMILEIIAGTALRQALRSSEVPTMTFVYTRWFHRGFGWVLAMSGMVNCYLGVSELLPGIKYYVLGYFVLITLVFIILSVWDDLRKDSLGAPSKLTTTTNGKVDRAFIAESHQPLTMHDVMMAVRGGNKWVMLDGWVFDVSKFMNSHPGGAFLIDGSVGTDIGQYFFGREAFSSVFRKHIHSQTAHNMLRGMCVGVLKSTIDGERSSNWADHTSGDRKEDVVVWTVAKRKVLNPGADREVVKLEFRNEASKGVPAVTWRKSTFGRHMLVRFPVESAEGTLEPLGTASSIHAPHRRGSLAAMLVGPVDGDFRERPYTIVRRDNREGFDLYVRHYPGGEVSPLVHQLSEGDDVTMLGPKGVGIHLDDNSHGVIVAVAQGTGIFTYFDTITYLLAKRREALRKGLRHTQSWRRPIWNGQVGKLRSKPSFSKPTESVWTVVGKAGARTASGRLHKVSSERSLLHSEGNAFSLPAVEESTSDQDLTHSSDDNDESSGAQVESTAVIIPEGAMLPVDASFGPTFQCPLPMGSAVTQAGGRATPTPSSEGRPSRSSTAWVDGVGASAPSVAMPASAAQPSRAGSPSQLAASTVMTLDPEQSTDSRGHSATPPQPQTMAGPMSALGPAKRRGLAAALPRAGAPSEGRAAEGEDTTEASGRIKLVLMACFSDEDNVFEQEWLGKCSGEIPDFELFVNVKTKNRGGSVLRNFRNTSTGYLTDEKLASLLPQKDLLFVSICGTSSFSRAVHDKFVAMGLPRGLVTVV